jgi:hypothetical protein
LATDALVAILVEAACDSRLLAEASRFPLLGLPRPDSSVVERGPEKAGVGGSIPSLATTLSNNLAATKDLVF